MLYEVITDLAGVEVLDVSHMRLRTRVVLDLLLAVRRHERRMGAEVDRMAVVVDRSVGRSSRDRPSLVALVSYNFV